MNIPDKADNATLMRIYKQGLTHTLDAALRGVYERGINDAIEAASTAHVPASTPTPAVAPVTATGSAKPTPAK